LIRRGGSVWGCDRCQEVCPMNKKARSTDIGAFERGRITRLTDEMLSEPDFAGKNRDRAFLWKGAAVLKRNLRIIEGKPADNTNKI